MNLTGAQGAQTLDCTVNQYNISGNCTQNAATTTTFNPGAGPVQNITYGGNFNYTVSTSGTVVMNGTSALHLRMTPTGAATTWRSQAFDAYLVDAGSTGMTISYVDCYYCSIGFRNSAGGHNGDNIRVYYGYQSNATGGVDNIASGGTNSLTNIFVWGSSGTTRGSIRFLPSGGTNTGNNWYCYGCWTGIEFAPTGGTNTLSNMKSAFCQQAWMFGGTAAINITNLASVYCDQTNASTVPAATSTITRIMVIGGGLRTNLTGAFDCSPGVGVVITLTEPYVGGRSVGNGIHNASGTTARMVVSGGVIASDCRLFATGIERGLLQCASSANDIVLPFPYSATATFFVAIRLGTSDGDYIAGSQSGFIGAVPSSNEGPLSNFADANMVVNVDGDSGNTTSTSAPVQYSGLDSNRLNPAATPNKPLTVTSIVATPGSNTVNVTFTTGIKARSRLLIGTSAGVTRANATTTSPWKYHGILDPELVDFTLPVTSHNHDVPLPPGTYYAVPECYDPCGRRFLGAETQFTIAAAAGGGGAADGSRRYDPREVLC